MKKKVLMLSAAASMHDQFNRENIKLLISMGCEVHIACNFLQGNNTSEKRVESFKEEMELKGVICHHIDFERNPYNLRKNREAYIELKNLMNKVKFDLIHSHTPVVSIYARKIAYKMSIPVIYTAHGFHFFKGAPLFYWLAFYPMEKFYSKKTDVLITINNEDYNRAKRKFNAKKIIKIPSVGLKHEYYDESLKNTMTIRNEFGISETAIVLISVGEINKNKNHRIILQAISRIKNYDLHYIICGKGSETEFLKELANQLHIDNRVHFAGYREDISDLLHASDIFCFPSKREGLGMAALEAMQSGLPLITSNVHGINDYMEDGITGYKCSPKDVESFTEAIEKLASNKILREKMGQYNKSAVSKFYCENTDLIMKDIYKQQLGISEKEIENAVI
ncbi:MAG: glycosyltransferase family 4 protein [Ruminococcus sp.]|nr:glycosyltransferase family 4 protein [Ruminococcus sp.]